MAKNREPEPEPEDLPEAREPQEPKVYDKRKIDPETGAPRPVPGDSPESAGGDVGREARAEGADAGAGDEPLADDGAPTDAESVEDLVEAEDADVELSEEDLSILAEAERDLVAEYRERAARAEAELKNFRTRVERDRAANREAVIAEVIRSLLPAIDDLDRADEHGDLVEGAPLTLVSQKLRAAFEKYGLRRVGEKGEAFDPRFHEAIVQLPSPDVTQNTVADVIETGYAMGDRLIRAAKVAVSVPE